MLLKHMFAVAAIGSLLGFSGCNGSGEVPRYPIAGTVSFQGTPIASGEITFEDPDSGFAAGGEIQDGSYELLVPAGKFKVFISPGLVETDPGDGESPPQMEVADSAKVPEKYRRVDTTDLTAKVTASSTTFDFDMK